MTEDPIGLFEFSDGHSEWMTDREAAKYCIDNDVVRTRYLRIYGDTKYRSAPRIKDAFVPHYSPVLGMQIETKQQYNAEIKKRGLTEVGNETLPPQKSPPRKGYLTDECISDLKHMGVRISDSWVKEVRDADR